MFIIFEQILGGNTRLATAALIEACLLLKVTYPMPLHWYGSNECGKHLTLVTKPKVEKNLLSLSCKYSGVRPMGRLLNSSVLGPYISVPSYLNYSIWMLTQILVGRTNNPPSYNRYMMFRDNVIMNLDPHVYKVFEKTTSSAKNRNRHNYTDV